MFIVLDLETTGLSTKDDAIIEIACVKIERRSFKEVARFTSFIHPEREIPDFIQTLTHISTKDIEDAPVFSEIRESLQEFLEGCPIIGHNIAFDVKFLQAAGIDISKNPAIDTFFLANFLCFQEKSLNL
jgi:ATP-dependent DNA helicase DinG